MTKITKEEDRLALDVAARLFPEGSERQHARAVIADALAAYRDEIIKEVL